MVDQCKDESLDAETRIEVCTDAIEETSDDAAMAELLRQRGRAMRQSGDVEGAMADLDQAIALAPDIADVYIDRAYAHGDVGDLDARLSDNQRAYELQPRYWRAVLTYMDALYKVGRHAECLELSEVAMEIASERFATYEFRGRCYAELDRFEEALADYDRAIELGLDTDFIHDNRGIALWYLGRYEQALAAAEEAIARNDGNESAYLTVIDSLLALGRAEDAISAYGQARADVVTDELGLANALAWGLYQSGRYDEGLAVIEEWLEENPDLESWNSYEADTYAHLLAAHEQSSEAIAWFLRAAELGGAEVEARYRSSMKQQGIEAAEGLEGLEAALQECVELGAECTLE